MSNSVTRVGIVRMRWCCLAPGFYRQARRGVSGGSPASGSSLLRSRAATAQSSKKSVAIWVQIDPNPGRAADPDC